MPLDAKLTYLSCDQRKRSLLGQHWLGLLSVGFVVTLSLLAFIALSGWQGEAAATDLWHDPWFWQVVRFSLWQATLSAVLSVLLAMPIARALALDRNLIGSQAFISWCLLCFVMPSLILITGIVALFGRSGTLSPWLGEGWRLYGLNGILLAHLFLNLPFAIRILTLQWQSIPTAAWKLSAQLGLGRWQAFRVVEWPVLRGVLPAVAGFIFLLCFNSFAVVLALGGGPHASTLEVAIFQSLKYDFNPSEALFLAWTQLLLAGSIYLMISRLGSFQWLAPAQTGQDRWLPQLSITSLWMGRVGYLLAWLYLTLPILVLFPLAFQADWQLLINSGLLAIVLRSLCLALSATLVALILGLSILSLWASVRQSRWSVMISSVALYPLVVPTMVLSVGIYLLLMPYWDWHRWGWVAIIGMNAVVVLPFVFKQLNAQVANYHQQYARLQSDLNLDRLTCWLKIYLPYLKPVLLQVIAMSFVFALGDMSIFAIFGNDDWRTLPWLIYTLAGSYRLAEAALVSLLLLACAFVALRWLERGR